MIEAPPPPPANEADVVEEARSRAYEQGLRDGIARKGEEVRQALLAFQRSVDELLNVRSEQMRVLGHYVNALAVAVAQKIVQREVATDASIVQALVTRGLELIPANTSIEVRMNAQDLEAIRAEIEETARRDRGEPVQWLADPALERGSFVIESPQRVVNGNLDSALRALYERLEYE
jgi:flagellar biosynthesis/type III secretory pathway protein FliH